eukprot:2028473-Pleurochrysis_carterae.AAC.1
MPPTLLCKVLLFRILAAAGCAAGVEFPSPERSWLHPPVHHGLQVDARHIRHAGQHVQLPVH